jgi:glycosyltransferase involved in cell wall biosynthesis
MNDRRMTVSPPRASPFPVVSIGVPVYNGARHLAQALNALLGQTFSNFEIIISDNASTDDTQAICEQFANADQRIRYLRQPRNIGAPRNWSFIVHEARGQYFKWASANDYCCERFVEKCLEALQNDPRVVLSFGRTCLVEEQTGVTTEYDEDLEALDDRPSDRFRRICRSLRLNNAQSGLIRLDVLRKTGLDRPYQGGDIVLMAELALRGCFKRVPEVVLFRRIGTTSLSAQLSAAELRYFIDPNAGAEAHSVGWRRHMDQFGAILHAPIAMTERLACLRTAAHDAYWDRSRLAAELSRFVRAKMRHSRTPR